MDSVMKREVISTLVAKLEKSNLREENIKKELANDEATLNKVNDMIFNEEVMPEDIGYENFDMWREAVEKQIETGLKSLAKIGEQKVEVEALNFYLDNIAE